MRTVSAGHRKTRTQADSDNLVLSRDVLDKLLLHRTRQAAPAPPQLAPSPRFTPAAGLHGRGHIKCTHREEVDIDGASLSSLVRALPLQVVGQEAPLARGQMLEAPPLRPHLHHPCQRRQGALLAGGGKTRLWRGWGVGPGGGGGEARTEL
eukprot:3529843-Rhodomonas_salina.2